MKLFTTAALVATMMSGAADADTWKIAGDASRVSFGSVKNSYIGEAHAFTAISGKVKDGKAKISINLASVATNIDIRNERMIEHVFNKAPRATLKADIDMASFKSMVPGETKVMEVEGTVSFLGQDIDVYPNLFVARLTEDRVLVTTDGMMYLDTDELGIDSGIDKLQELASLDDITRSVPITLRLVFDLVETNS